MGNVKKLPVDDLSGLKIQSQLINILQKIIFLKLMFNIVKSYMTFTMVYHSHLWEWKIKIWKMFSQLAWKNICDTNKNLNQVLNHGLVLRYIEVHRVIKFHHLC